MARVCVRELTLSLQSSPPVQSSNIMFPINPPSGNVRIQKLIAKHIFEWFEKRKEEDGKSKYCRS